jgi:hypothetical protein
MFRSVSKSSIRLGQVGDTVEMDCSDLADLRGQLELEVAAVSGYEVAFEFNCSSDVLTWIEPTPSTRLSSAAPLTTSVIDCRAYASVRLRVVTASASTDGLCRLTLAGYAPHCG